MTVNTKPAAGQTAGQGKATNAGVRHCYYSVKGQAAASLEGRKTIELRILRWTHDADH